MSDEFQPDGDEGCEVGDGTESDGEDDGNDEGRRISNKEVVRMPTGRKAKQRWCTIIPVPADPKPNSATPAAWFQSRGTVLIHCPWMF